MTTDLRDLAERMRAAADELEQTGRPFDAVWATNLRQNARGLILLSLTNQHLMSAGRAER